MASEDEKDLGCCGYDELAVKPATTRPMTFAGRFPKKEAKEMSSKKVPTVHARAVPRAMPPAPGVTLQGKAPIQTAGAVGTPLSVKSPFGGVRGNVGMANEVRLLGAPTQTQAVQEVLARESDPEGLRADEAAAIAAELSIALPLARAAAGRDVPCTGIDQDVLSGAQRILEAIGEFETSAAEGDRLALTDEELNIVDAVLECGGAVRDTETKTSNRTLALVLGGVVIGFGVIVAVTG